MNQVKIEGNKVATVSGTLFSSIASGMNPKQQVDAIRNEFPELSVEDIVEIVEMQEVEIPLFPHEMKSISKATERVSYTKPIREEEIQEILKQVEEIQAANPTMTGQKFQSKKGGYVFTVLYETETGVMLKWVGDGPSYKRHVTFEALVKGYTNA